MPALTGQKISKVLTVREPDVKCEQALLKTRFEYPVLNRWLYLACQNCHMRAELVLVLVCEIRITDL